MSDHEMQFFPETGGEQDESALKNWSSEQPSAPPELFPAYYMAEEKVDKQSVERVWGRLEEHVSRNREFYYHNRNVPSLLVQTPPAFSSPGSTGSTRKRPARFLRMFPWRRLDTIAAILFLTLLMGTLLTIVYNVQQQTQLGAPGSALPSAQEICKGVMTSHQQVTLVEGSKGIEFFPPIIIMREGGQLTWINQTSNDQVVVDASTKAGAIKVALHDKELAQTLQKASTYTFYAQSAEGQSSKELSLSEPAKSARVVVEVLSMVVIAPDGDGIGGTFRPSVMKVPQGGDLVWLNTTSGSQVVINTIRKQEAPFSLSPNSCRLQHDIQQGSYSYTLKGSNSARFSLYAG